MDSKPLSSMFREFFDSEKSAGMLLIFCAVVSMAIANSPLGREYQGLWLARLGGLSLEHWINDALMAMFFLLIGLELERELYVGELSNFRNALLPIVAALGGMAAPALIHFSLNAGTPAQSGIGIPMATDIAFALGALAILGNRIPASLKVFIVAFAVMDDLGAIIIIAIFYTSQLFPIYLVAALAVWGLLLALNLVLRVTHLLPYLLGGALMWFFMLKSGVHATIAGVLLAFAIPFSARGADQHSPSHRLEHFMHKPVAFCILPIFALANTAIAVPADWFQHLTSANSIGIAAGLVLGKPIGVMLFCVAAVAIGLCRLPSDLTWRHVIGGGMLGGIGFTMSIFIANLAFPANPEMIVASKMAILLASLTSAVFGILWLRFCSKDA